MPRRKAHKARNAWKLVSGMVVVLSSLAWGEEPKPKPAPAAVPTKGDLERKQRLDWFVPRLKELRLSDPDKADRKIALVESPLLSFENPVSQITDGFMFAWTDRGRPVAVMKSYWNHRSKSWGRTVVSLADHKLTMEVDGQVLWTPPESLSFAPLKGAPRPPDRPAARLVQMRKLAEQFSVVDKWGLKDPSDWQLRLLTTPLHRYECPDEDVVDGAIFGYVLTTSPEALVLLEAQGAGENLAWHYAVSRFTRFEITVSREGETLATFPRLEAWPPTGSYFHHPVPMQDYPFKTPPGSTPPDP